MENYSSQEGFKAILFDFFSSEDGVLTWHGERRRGSLMTVVVGKSKRSPGKKGSIPTF